MRLHDSTFDAIAAALAIVASGLTVWLLVGCRGVESPGVPKSAPLPNAANAVQPERTNAVAWSLPPCADSYWWNVETATKPQGPWTVVVSNATGWPTVTADQPCSIYRLVGRDKL